ncbi:MAG: hypothetical protein CML46_13135 [Rhodobacteraceae bacterium]|nr:hypothetical protein [Paracoccaceae bacterium]MBR27873.1 hypothetical protein [Paracoccaceae bacterium]
MARLSPGVRFRPMLRFRAREPLRDVSARRPIDTAARALRSRQAPGSSRGVRRRGRAAALALLVCLAAWSLPGPARAQAQSAGPGCALALILALDVSGSVDPGEWRLQADGLADAFRSPDLQEVVSALDGDLAVAVTQWTGAGRQHLALGWTRLSSPASMRGFAVALGAMPRAWRHFSTAIGDAIDHAVGVGRAAPEDCARKVIDVSGDGASNEGAAPAAARLRALAEGWTINGLAIAGADPPPAAYYRAEVIIGPRAFVETARDFEAYPPAILRKLLREIRADALISRAAKPEAPRLAGFAPAPRR